jgi:single-stranded DNA-binding protein
MTGSFTWNAIVRVGTLKPNDQALVITVVHEVERYQVGQGASSTPAWNTVVCFKHTLRSQLEAALAPGDLVHLQGYVRTGSFTDDKDDKRRTVDLVVTQFDLLNKHIDGPETA